MTDAPVPLAILRRDVVYREQGGADFTVTRVRVRDTGTGNRFAVHYASVKDGNPGAVCVAVHGRRLLLARHWRVTTGAWEWEFPRGMSQVGEASEQTALREFHEETGIRATPDGATLLQYMHADTGVLKDSIGVVSLAVGDDVHVDAHDWELSNLTWAEPESIDRMIADGEIVDGITIAAYAIWRLKSVLQ